jgi:hypothetical protein
VTTWEELWKVQNNETSAPRTAKAKGMQTLPFGKYKGELFCDVPADYLQWLLKQDITEPLRTACKDALGSKA